MAQCDQHRKDIHRTVQAAETAIGALLLLLLLLLLLVRCHYDRSPSRHYH